MHKKFNEKTFWMVKLTKVFSLESQATVSLLHMIMIHGTLMLVGGVISLLRIDGAHRILVATSEGRVYVGGIDPRDGGDCKILRDYRFLIYWSSCASSPEF